MGVPGPHSTLSPCPPWQPHTESSTLPSPHRVHGKAKKRLKPQSKSPRQGSATAQGQQSFWGLHLELSYQHPATHKEIHPVVCLMLDNGFSGTRSSGTLALGTSEGSTSALLPAKFPRGRAGEHKEIPGWSSSTAQHWSGCSLGTEGFGNQQAETPTCGVQTAPASAAAAAKCTQEPARCKLPPTAPISTKTNVLVANSG